MPTFTALALDRLIEPGTARSKSSSDPVHVKNTKEVTVRSEKQNGSMNGTTMTKKVVQKRHHWTQISPALYTTPEATPVPDTPSSFPPSPYLINHKRRGASLARRSSTEIISEVSQILTTHVADGDTSTELSLAEKDILVPDALPVLKENAAEPPDPKIDDAINEVVDENDSQSITMLSPAREGESDNFFDPRDSLSYSSYSDGEDGASLESSIKFASSAGEFYDAPEELSSDSGTPQSWQPPSCDFESELCEMKLALLAEIEQRKQAENALQHMRCQWLKLKEQLSSVGIVLPSDFPLHTEADPGIGADACEQINIARFVSEAVGRGIAKAEAEKEMEAQLELKNFEISRLNDRLHYYETVNQEMSQRNQEIIESARRLRHQRNQRRRWVWGSVATAITVGTAALAWSFLPGDKGPFLSRYEELPKESDNSGK
uniref:Uncharacterized protein n=1 Tax=Kalanchoe fedtschenkoi TaxID=63787 RepID=A0A7N0UBZ5_KALFE